MKRLLDCTASEIAQMNKTEKLKGIQKSEGRIIVSEVTTIDAPNALKNACLGELYASMGADCLMLNVFDVMHPFILNLPVAHPQDSIRELKRLTGKLVGTNLEAIPQATLDSTDFIKLSPGRISNRETLLKCQELGMDFISLTGNPNTGVTNQEIMLQVALAKELIGDNMIIMAGKMHAAGSLKEAGSHIISKDIVKGYAKAGADIIILPAPGTVPGITTNFIRELVDYAHSFGVMTLTAIGTSQEDSDQQTLRQIALMAKMTGTDMHHIGDAGYAGATPESTMIYSFVVRGKRHTYNRIATSPLR